MTEAALYRLMSWLSPAYPVGAFSHSHGLEWAVEQGWVNNRIALIGWLGDLLDHGGAWSDGVLLCHGHAAAMDGDRERLGHLAGLAAALSPSLERRVETLAQGAAFLTISRSSWPVPSLDLFDDEIEEVAYPLVVGVLGAGHGVPITLLLPAYLHGFVGNLVSAAQRLVPLGQTDAQQAIAALLSKVEAVAARLLALDPAVDPLEQLGGCALRSDIASMRHETQYTRLFRT